MPDQIQLHSWVTIQLHCSVWALPRVDCMSVFPPGGAEETGLLTWGFCDSWGEVQATCPNGLKHLHL